VAEELTGKIAIVTGGAKGIGAATAEVFVEEGAMVVIGDTDRELGQTLAARLGSAARFKEVDVSERRDVQALVDFTIAEFGGLHVMFNNAAITGAFHNRFLDDPLQDFDKVMHTDLAGVMYGCQIAGRHMCDAGGGSIINTTSVAAIDPSYAILTYRAAKAGVINFTKSLAIDLAEYRIRVNAVAPGHIPTTIQRYEPKNLSPEGAAAYRKAVEQAWMSNQPLKFKGTPRDVANAVLYLASDRARYVTGQVIAVDGGMTAGDATNQSALLQEAHERFFATGG